MGLIDISEISWVVNAIELSLQELGRCEFKGTANQVFLKHYFKLIK